MKISGIPTTISETLYKYLKNAIMEGKLSPNQRIQEKEIAELFKVSTTPVREAFQRLSAEQYIIINSRKEVVVASATLEEIKELFELMRILDTFATEKSLKTLSDKDITELKKWTKKLNYYYKQKKIVPYFKQNMKIHDKLWSLCGNNLLYQTLVNMTEKCLFYANQLLLLTDNRAWLNQSHKDHLDLIKAVEKRDDKSLKKILLSHWGKGFLGEEKTASTKK
ncbi:MAG: GntR family transcriptional regulator [Candidatus Aminicenantes bacterium]